MSDAAHDYARGAQAWAGGPTRIYARLAVELVAFSPDPLQACSVLDLGSGTGAGTRAAEAQGARVIGTDLTYEMLLVDRERRPPATAADACALPFRRQAFDVVLAPFCLNHLDDPALGVREASRVGRRLLASTYATDDDHPAKRAVEVALGELGWTPPAWYADVKRAMAAWGTVTDATDAVERGGMTPVRVEHRAVVFDGLGPDDMVAWRTGLAPCAAFVEALPDSERTQLRQRALELLGPNPPPIERRVIFVAAGH